MFGIGASELVLIVIVALIVGRLRRTGQRLRVRRAAAPGTGAGRVHPPAEQSLAKVRPSYEVFRRRRCLSSASP